MRRKSMNGPLVRAVGVISAVMLLVTSATFAALQSQQALLTGNTIESATADLRIGTSATSFGATRAGFDFEDIVPGGSSQPADGHVFYLKNYGSAALNLRMSVGSVPTNPSAVDLSKVYVHMTRVDSGTVFNSTLQDLTNSYATNGMAVTEPIAPGAVVQYKLRASMAIDAFSGSGASIGAVDFVFSGIAP